MDLKKPLLTTLLTLSCNATAEWIEYSVAANGDAFYFDNTRVQKDGDLVDVWSRTRYQSSVMGASSYQSLMQLNCAEHSETTLQSTFYIDNNWSSPAMATNTRKQPEVAITANSATQRLADMLCE
ncbi:MAG: hypothetical protein QNJ91_07860 [Gammaproteobacteria bacterium]|nr:hypothetical protein [Gammaproteobacteria bacterium]